MLPKIPSFWRLVPQIFLGFFFMAVVAYKINISGFGQDSLTLGDTFTRWIAQGFPIGPYAAFMVWIQPHIVLLSVLVLILQGMAGMLLFCNVRVRWAAIMLFLVQFNIFLATFHSLGFNYIVGISLWIAVYYYRQPTMSKRLWAFMTVVLVVLACIAISERYRAGDPWLSSVAWQRAYYDQNLMASSPAVKQMFLAATDGWFGALLWAGMWWLSLGLALSLLTPFRLYGGAAWLVFQIVRTVVFMSSYGADGVLWTLTIFVWVTQEEYRVRMTGEQNLFHQNHSPSSAVTVPVSSGRR